MEEKRKMDRKLKMKTELWRQVFKRDKDLVLDSEWEKNGTTQTLTCLILLFPVSNQEGSRPRQTSPEEAETPTRLEKAKPQDKPKPANQELKLPRMPPHQQH